MKTGVINEFRGEYYFLSNYYTAPMEWRRAEFKSAEQAFAYAKTFFATGKPQDVERLRESIMFAKTPGDAKKLGRGVPINVDAWDKHKVQLMREIVHAKFRTATGVVGPLINTGCTMLVEGNDWGDKFWGRCLDKSTGRWVGLNTLGVILMEERGWWSRSDEGRP